MSQYIGLISKGKCRSSEQEILSDKPLELLIS